MYFFGFKLWILIILSPKLLVDNRLWFILHITFMSANVWWISCVAIKISHKVVLESLNQRLASTHYLLKFGEVN